jgi:hypothetical protein
MALVRHMCGACGAEVQQAERRCGACGKNLEWDDASVPRGGIPRVAPQKRVKQAGERVRRRIEPWQVISIIAVGALVVFLGWLELTRDHGTELHTSVQAPPALATPMAAAQVNLEPLEAAVAAQPTDAAAVLRLANALHDNGMVPRAIDQYRRYLTMRPGDADARVDLGICYDQLGMVDSVRADQYYLQAIKEMETALKVTPNHQPAAFNLGIVNLHRGQLEESNAWLKKAVALNKSSELGMRAQQILQQHSFTP